jgi:hypothetical protein
MRAPEPYVPLLHPTVDDGIEIRARDGLGARSVRAAPAAILAGGTGQDAQFVAVPARSASARQLARHRGVEPGLTRYFADAAVGCAAAGSMCSTLHR